MQLKNSSIKYDLDITHKNLFVSAMLKGDDDGMKKYAKYLDSIQITPPNPKVIDDNTIKFWEEKSLAWLERERFWRGLK